MVKAASKSVKPKSESDWRGETLDRVRTLILAADPEMVEERKWKKPTNPAGVPTWSHDGIVCTGETYKSVVKLTFAKGAKLPDPAGLFNASLEGNARRAIDLHEGESIDAKAFKALIKAAVALNAPASDKAKKPTKSAPKASLKKLPKNENGVVMLSGGNPQIAKGYGEAPVRQYIANMPGWKQAVGRRLDEIITETLPGVLKAVKWNTPMYGMSENHFFIGFHCMTKYIKVAFFHGASLSPMPPVESKQKHVRYLHISEGDHLDEAQFAAWIKAASQLPGEKM